MDKDSIRLSFKTSFNNILLTKNINIMIYRSLFLCTLFIFSYFISSACTAVCVNTKHGVYAAKGYDWDSGEGYLLTNRSGITKSSFIYNLQWTSKYGSVTFNQYGKEMPIGGMNEAGLVVEALWLDGTKYSPDAQKGYVNELEWVQYQLDNSCSVSEVIASLNEVAIKPIAGELHYFIADINGESAVVDYVDGIATVSYVESGKQALTNNQYKASEAYAGKSKVDRKCKSSLCRYTTACNRITNIADSKDDNISDQLFDMLSDVKINNYTKWNIVYDITARKILFRSTNAMMIKELDLNDFDFTTSANVLALNVDYKTAGTVSDAFQKYSCEKNYELISHTLKAMQVPVDPQMVNMHQMPICDDKTIMVEK